MERFSILAAIEVNEAQEVSRCKTIGGLAYHSEVLRFSLTGTGEPLNSSRPYSLSGRLFSY